MTIRKHQSRMLNRSREVKKPMSLLREQGTSCSLLLFLCVAAGIGKVLQKDDRRGRGRMVGHSEVIQFDV